MTGPIETIYDAESGGAHVITIAEGKVTITVRSDARVFNDGTNMTEELTADQADILALKLQQAAKRIRDRAADTRWRMRLDCERHMRGQA